MVSRARLELLRRDEIPGLDARAFERRGAALSYFRSWCFHPPLFSMPLHWSAASRRDWKVEPSGLGVPWESCHGPGEAHVASRGKAGTIQNPSRFKAGELNMFCGTCHRKPPEEGEETDWS